MYRELTSEAAISDAFFNSDETADVSVDYADSLGGEELMDASKAFKARVLVPWTAERLCEDYMRRL